MEKYNFTAADFKLMIIIFWINYTSFNDSVKDVHEWRHVSVADMDNFLVTHLVDSFLETYKSLLIIDSMDYVFIVKSSVLRSYLRL